MAYDCHKRVFFNTRPFSLSHSHTYTHIHTRLIISLITFSPSLALVLSEILVAKAIRRYRAVRSCVKGMQDTFSMARHPYNISFSRLVVILVLSIVLRYIYIYIFICISSKGHECVQYKIANVLIETRSYENSSVRFYR